MSVPGYSQTGPCGTPDPEVTRQDVWHPDRPQHMLEQGSTHRTWSHQQRKSSCPRAAASLLEPVWSEKLCLLWHKNLAQALQRSRRKQTAWGTKFTIFIMFGYTTNKDFLTENPLQHHIYQYQHSDTNSVNNNRVIIIFHLHIKSLWAFIW